jgi:hypothetical protein
MFARLKDFRRIATRYEDIADASLRTRTDEGAPMPTAGMPGHSDFVAERSGTDELTFELVGADIGKGNSGPSLRKSSRRRPASASVFS